MASTQPDFTAHRGDLVCRPVHWMDIVRFIVFNFVLHAVTVMSTPGEGIGRSIANRLIALFLPIVGTMGAVRTIYRYARGEPTPLSVALRAQALCMIEPAVSSPMYLFFSHCSLTNECKGYGHSHEHRNITARSCSNPVPPLPLGFLYLEKRARPGSSISRWRGDGNTKDSLPHGDDYTRPTSLRETWLQGVGQRLLPHTTEVYRVAPRHCTLGFHGHSITLGSPRRLRPRIQLQRDQDHPIAQILYGTFQLYQSSGPQIHKAGYAAYQLTVIPYILMSLINLLASLCEPEFPAIFLVRRISPPGSAPEAISGEVGNVSPPAVERSMHTTRMTAVCPPNHSFSRAPR